MNREKWHTTLRLLFAFFLLGALGLAGCRKVQNPMGEGYEREHNWLFCNYTVKNTIKGEMTVETPKKEEASPRYDGQTLRLLVWAGYLPDWVIEGFTERFGVRVEVKTYQSNLELYHLLVTDEECDLILPTGYMAQRMIEEDRLATINEGEIPNISNLEEEFKSSYFDPEIRHLVPYLWTTAGIAYNAKYFDKTPRTWADLFDPELFLRPELKGKMALIPSGRQNLAAALMALGYSPNVEDKKRVKEAIDFLGPKLKHYHRTPIIKRLEELGSEEMLITQAYACDVAKLDKTGIHFAIPEEGSWLKVDHFAIPKQVTPAQKRLAEVFINYMLEPAVAAAVVNHSNHGSTIVGETLYLKASVTRGIVYMRPPVGKQTFVLSTSARNEILQEEAVEKMEAADKAAGATSDAASKTESLEVDLHR